MKNFLTEMLILDTKHGMDCTVEVCKPGYPDEDELIYSGPAGECLRYMMEYELPLAGDVYFSFTTNQDNYCGYNFEEIAYRMGYIPENLEEIVGWQNGLDCLIENAASRADCNNLENGIVKGDIGL